MLRANRFLLFILILLMPTVALAQTLEVTVGNGANSNITGADGQCRKITNSCGATIMVPSKTSSEWTSYYGGTKPACSAVASCATTCTAPWGTVYADGTSNSVVSPTRYFSEYGCTTQSGGPTCSSMRVRVSCAGGTLTCTSTGSGATLSCADTYTTCSNDDCGGGGGGCPLC